MSPYFQDLHSSYQAEIDDLAFDSEGQNVLQRRLRDKRSAFEAIVGHLDTHPLLLAPVFHGAFAFPEHRIASIEDLLTRVPGDFRPWAEIAAQVEVAGWAHPMVSLVLEQEAGDAFLSMVLGLEYARNHQLRGGDDDYDLADESSADDTDDDSGLADEEGESFLEEQGFDRRTLG